jgi:hypothetical protein
VCNLYVPDWWCNSKRRSPKARCQSLDQNSSNLLVPAGVTGKSVTASRSFLAPAVHISGWPLKYYIPAPPIVVAGIVAEPTDDLHRLQDALIKAVEPYTVKTGTPAAFFSEDGGRDIQAALISYVENFVRDAAGKRFNPHVTIGVGTEKYFNETLAEPFPSFTFSPTGASVYQLGAFGTARKELKALTPTP